VPIFELDASVLVPIRRQAIDSGVYEAEIEQLLWDNLEEITGENLFRVARQAQLPHGGRRDIVTLDPSAPRRRDRGQAGRRPAAIDSKRLSPRGKRARRVSTDGGRHGQSGWPLEQLLKNQMPTEYSASSAPFSDLWASSILPRASSRRSVAVSTADCRSDW
jgi:hypothetical protein